MFLVATLILLLCQQKSTRCFSGLLVQAGPLTDIEPRARRHNIGATRRLNARKLEVDLASPAPASTFRPESQVITRLGNRVSSTPGDLSINLRNHPTHHQLVLKLSRHLIISCGFQPSWPLAFPTPSRPTLSAHRTEPLSLYKSRWTAQELKRFSGSSNL